MNHLSEPQDAISDLGQMTSVREVPAWLISLGVHVLILFVFFSIQFSTQTHRTSLVTSAFAEPDPELYKFDPTLTDQFSSDGKFDIVGPSQSASTEVSKKKPDEIRLKLDEVLLPVDVPVTNEIPEPSEADFAETFDAVGSTDHPGGVEGAMDRLTYEIINSLKERKTLVVWLFDESDSLKDRRNVIADRFENVYKQVGQFDVGADVALQTAIVGFNEDTHFYTEKPVKDIGELIGKVRNLRRPKTKNENVFSAVLQIAKKWKGYRFTGTRQRPNMMIFIVTDERGDDFSILEQSIQFCRRNGIRVYCVGNSAVFGREKGYVTWTYADGFQRDLPVDQGPETVAPERLQLPFWSGPSVELERMSASFGPYALTRLCAETGGMYFVAAQSRFGPQFEPAVMRNYPPDYRPMRDYHKQLVTNQAKGALVRASKLTWDEGFPRPRLSFRADTDNALRQEITAAQRPLAKLDYRLRELEAVISRGVKDRVKLKSPRWRAGFDLAIGRLYAWRVRAYGYNTILAEMKSSPATFKTKGNNQWRLVPSEKISGPPAVRKIAKNATMYLSRVIEEHPDTPWAILAQKELDQPLGWQWNESRMVIPKIRPGNNNKRIQLAEDNRKKRRQQRKQAPKKRVEPLL
ncbi:MAG: VWA domain-containing protein [Planctomycetes bacterium]|nr:VWA domain-containing protein [Planctomycetota bacterium]